MGDVGDTFRALRDHNRERKAAHGVACADCKVNLPKAQPKILMPSQQCWCGYRDPRSKRNYDD